MLDVQLKASWLVCRKECIPEDGEFLLKLPLQGSTALHQAAFDAALAAQPAALAAPGAIAIDGNKLQVRLDGLPAAARGKTLEFFPETGEVIHTAAVQGKDWTQAWQGETWTATVPLADQRSASPAVMPVVVALAEADGRPASRSPGAPKRRSAATGRRRRRAAQVSPALQAALEANAAGAPAASRPAASSPRCSARCSAACC